MSEAQRKPAKGPTAAASAWMRVGLGLSVTPCALALAECVLPSMHVDPFLGDVIAFAGATAFPIIGLTVAATAEVTVKGALAIAAPAALTLIALALRQPSPSTTLLFVSSALVALAWALGTSLGRRVQHAAHLLPACVVAACADLMSVLSPEGPSHAIAASDRALSVLAVGFPVPGTEAVAPALGVGDLLFIALVLGVARAHSLPYLRTVLLCSAGTALAGAASAYFGVAVPALVLIAAAVVLGLPRVRQLRRADRTAALVSMVIASSLALATVLRGYLMRH